MTTAAMVLGVMPLVLATGAGAAARQAMGIVIAMGMGVGTLFTLFVVPTFYTYIAPATVKREEDVAAPRRARRPCVRSGRRRSYSSYRRRNRS